MSKTPLGAADPNLPEVSEQAKEQQATIGRLGIGASISMVGKVLGRGIDFVKQIILARVLSVEAFGLYALIWNLLRVVEVLAALGLQNGVIQFATPYHPDQPGKFKDVVFRTLSISLTVSAVISGLLWLAAPWLAENWFKDPDFVWAFRIFVLMLVPTVGLRVAVSGTRISQKMQYGVYTEELTQSISALLLFVLFFWAGWQLAGAIWATTISFLLAFLLACYYLYRLFPSAWKATREMGVNNKELLTYSIPTALSGMFSVIVNRMDRIFIGFYLTTAEVGIYQAAAQFSIIFAIVLDGFNAIFSPIIADLYHAGRFDELQEIFRVSTKWGIYVNAPFILLIFLMPGVLIEAVFGPEYLLAVVPLLILTAGQAVNIGVGGVGRLLIMTGRQNSWLLSSGSFMVMSMVLNVIFIPRWGVVGAATTTAVTIASLYITGLLQVRALLKLWPYDARYKKGALAALITIGGLMLLNWLELGPAWLVLILALAMACGLFYGTLLLLGLDEEDKTFFAQIMRRASRASSKGTV